MPGYHREGDPPFPQFLPHPSPGLSWPWVPEDIQGQQNDPLIAARVPWATPLTMGHLLTELPINSAYTLAMKGQGRLLSFLIVSQGQAYSPRNGVCLTVQSNAGPLASLNPTV